MAKYWSKDVHLYFDRYHLGTATTNLVLGLEFPTLDPTALEDVAEKALAGFRADVLEWSGIYDDADSWDQVMGSLLNVPSPIFTVYIGSGTGSVAYAGSAHVLGIRPDVSMRELVLAGVAVQIDGPINPCLLHAPQTNSTGSSVFGSIDNTTTSTAGGTMFAHVLSMTGSLATGTATLVIQDSNDASAWNDLCTLTFTSATAQIGTVAGTVNRYTRARYSSSTAGTTQYLIVFKRN